MLFSSVVAFAALAATTMAAPLETRAAPVWTIQKFTRTCKTAASCDYAFTIKQNDGTATTACKYTVKAADAAKASYMETCGAYRVSSSWSGQFGPNNGFQTLAVVKAKSIVYPAYADWELVSGKAVSPDKSYNVETL